MLKHTYHFLLLFLSWIFVKRWHRHSGFEQYCQTEILKNHEPDLHKPADICLKIVAVFFFIIVMPEIFRHIYLRFSSPFSINKIARFYNWYLRHHKSPHLAWSFKLTNGKIQQLAMVNRDTWVSGLVAVLRMERHWRVHWQKSVKFVCCLHWCCSLVVFGHLPSSQ